MYVKTLKLANLLEQMKEDIPYDLKWVSQETIDALISRWLIVELPN